MSRKPNSHSVGPYDTAPWGPWQKIRGGLALIAAWAVVVFGLSVVVLVALLTFRLGVDRYRHVVANTLGRTVLWLGGIKLRVVGGERLAGRKARLLAINHSSQLDLFALLAIVPPGANALAKKEIFRIPFLGWAFFAFDVVSIDRSNLSKAKRSVAEAARRLREDRASVVVSPEGTRSADGKLAPFKMGLFHLGAESGVPIVPLVIRGSAACQPKGAIIPRPGVIEIELLPEIDTSDYGQADLHEKRDELRALYVGALARGPSPDQRSG